MLSFGLVLGRVMAQIRLGGIRTGKADAGDPCPTGAGNRDKSTKKCHEKHARARNLRAEDC